MIVSSSTSSCTFPPSTPSSQTRLSYQRQSGTCLPHKQWKSEHANIMTEATQMHFFWLYYWECSTSFQVLAGANRALALKKLHPQCKVHLSCLRLKEGLSQAQELQEVGGWQRALVNNDSSLQRTAGMVRRRATSGAVKTVLGCAAKAPGSSLVDLCFLGAVHPGSH